MGSLLVMRENMRTRRYLGACLYVEFAKTEMVRMIEMVSNHTIRIDSNEDIRMEIEFVRMLEIRWNQGLNIAKQRRDTVNTLMYEMVRFDDTRPRLATVYTWFSPFRDILREHIVLADRAVVSLRQLERRVNQALAEKRLAEVLAGFG